MQKVATSDEMRSCDRTAIQQIGIPGILLMENASRGILDAIQNECGSVEGKKVFIFCGKGNNGGDGLAVARHLFNRGAHVHILLAGRMEEVKGDAKINLDIIKKMVNEKGSASVLEFHEIQTKKHLRRLGRSDLIIDALLGTGMKGDVQGIIRDIIEWINGSGVKVVAVDIPSGVNSDTGQVGNIAVKAHITVTMALRKRGLLMGKGREHTGSLYVADISTPRFVLNTEKIKTYWIEAKDIATRLPKRPLDAHKHSCGKIFVLAGSRGLSGAAAMCSESAMRVGAGAVVLGIPASLNPILEEKVTEVMTAPLADSQGGSLSMDALPAINEHIMWADVLLIGPGLSRNSETQELVLELIPKLDRPTVIDADGLNALAEDLSVLKKTKADIILTPHYGELSRLVRLSAKEIELDRVEVARRVARELKVVLILKGAPTVVAHPDGNVYINSTGNPGMATAGAGDILAGAVVGLIAQKLSTLDAAIAGVYLHGLAGDIAKEHLGEMSLMAMDIMRHLPAALQSLRAHRCS